MNFHSAIFSKYLGDEQMRQLISDGALTSRLLIRFNLDYR